jgi:hypothetical protein
MLAGAPLLGYASMGISTATSAAAIEAYCSRHAARPTIEVVETRTDPMVRQLVARLESARFDVDVEGPRRDEISTHCREQSPYETTWTIRTRVTEGAVPDLLATWDTAGAITREVSAEHGFRPDQDQGFERRSLLRAGPDDAALRAMLADDGSITIIVESGHHQDAP